MVNLLKAINIKQTLLHNHDTNCRTNKLIATEGLYDLYERTYKISNLNFQHIPSNHHAQQSRDNKWEFFISFINLYRMVH